VVELYLAAATPGLYAADVDQLVAGLLAVKRLDSKGVPAGGAAR
jgi:hypothetical protein